MKMENYNFPPNIFASLNPTYTPSGSQATPTNQAGNEVDNAYLEQILDMEALEVNPNLTAASRGSTNSKGHQQQYNDGAQTSDAISNLRKYRRKSREQTIQSGQTQPHAQLSAVYYPPSANNIGDVPYNLRSRTKSRTLSENYPGRNQVNNSNHLQGGGIINVQNDQQIMSMFNSFTGTAGNYYPRPAQHSAYDTREGNYSHYPQVPKKRRRVDNESSSLTDSNTRSQAQPLDLRTNEFPAPLLAQNLQSSLHHSLLASSLADLDNRQSHTQEEILAGKTLLSLNRSSQCNSDSRYPPSYTRAGQQVSSYPGIDQYYSNINNAGVYTPDFTQQIRYNLQHNLNSITDPSQNTLPGYYTGYQTPSYNYMTSVTPNPSSEYSTNYRVNTDWQSQPFQRSDQFRSPTNSLYSSSAHHQPPPPYTMPCPPHWYGQYSYNNYPTQNMGDSSNTGQQLNSCSQRNLPFNSPLLNPTRSMSNILAMNSTSVLSTPAPPAPTLSSMPVATPGRATRGRTPSSRRATTLQIAPQAATSAPAGEGSRKRTRTTYNSMQLKILEQEFTIQQYCTQEIKNRLSKQLNMTPNQVKVWFQNRRTREKKNNPKFSSKTRGSRRGRKITSDKNQADNEESDGGRMQLRPRRAPSVIIDTPPDPMPDLQIQTPEPSTTNLYRFPYSSFTNGGSYKVNYAPSMPVLTKYSPTAASTRAGANPILSGLIARNQQPTVRCGDDHKTYQDSQNQSSTSQQNSVLPNRPVKLGDIPQNSHSLRKQICANDQLLNSLSSRTLGSSRNINNFSQNFYNSSQSNEVVRTMLNNSFPTENSKVNSNGTTLDQNGSYIKDQFKIEMFEGYDNSSPQASKQNLNHIDQKSDAIYGYQQDVSPPRFPASPEVQILEDRRSARNERKNITEIVSNQQRGFVYQIKDEPPSEDLNSNYNTDVSSAENQNGSTSGEEQTDALKNMEDMVNKCPSGGSTERNGAELAIANHISKSHISNSFTSNTYENISSPEVQIALSNYQSNLNQPLSVGHFLMEDLNIPYEVNTIVPKSEVSPETSSQQNNSVNLNSNLMAMPGFSFTNPLNIANGDNFKQPVSATSSSFEGSSSTPPRTIKENNSPEVINGSQNGDQKQEPINGYTSESVNKTNPFSFNLERGKPIDVNKIHIPPIDIKTEVEEVDDDNGSTYPFTTNGHPILNSNPSFPSYTFNSSNKVETKTTSDSEPSHIRVVFRNRKACESIYNTSRSLNSPNNAESIITSNPGPSFTNSSTTHTSASNDVTSMLTSDSGMLFAPSNLLFNTPASRNLSNNIDSIIASNTEPLLHNSSTNNSIYLNSVFNTSATRNTSNNAESSSNSTVTLPVGYDHLFTTDGALLTIRGSNTDNGSSNNRRPS